MPPPNDPRRAPSVLLVSMPWTTLTEPSLGLCGLRAVLDQQGIACRVLHLHMFLLQHLHARTYTALSQVYALNDFLFSGVLDPVVTHTQQRWLRHKVRDLLSQGIIDRRRLGGSEGVVAALLRLRSEVLPAWLAGWADEIARHEASLVGFTCMFDQTIAALALARMVRDRAPDKMLALGGYAVRSPTAQMIVRSSPWIDAVCNGEGEISVVELAHAAAGQMPLCDVRGIVCRSAAGEPIITPPAPAVDLDQNPTPNFDDFFADVRRLSAQHRVDVSPPHLPIENSRGCWWGAKHHCVFCGIKNEDMAYRARDAAQVMRSFDELHARYGMNTFRFADYILPHRYFTTLLPELVRRGRPYNLSTEMKSNTTEERFRLLAQAGFEEVQPGIESFSSDVLRRMDKGVSAVQNVHTLMLGRRFGVRIRYNLLYGFPDDQVAEYERMAAMLPRLVHLDPPMTCVPVQITRFAPLQTHASRFGIDKADPEPCYDLVFSRGYLENTGFDIADYCYFFARPFENATNLQRVYQRLGEIAVQWHVAFAEPAAWLYAVEEDGGLVVHDRRLEPEETVYRLGPPLTRILSACTSPTSLQALQDEHPSEPDLAGVVAELDKLGLLFQNEDQLVSLVLPGPPQAPSHRSLWGLGSVAVGAGGSGSFGLGPR